jgi:hypothetical protein
MDAYLRAMLKMELSNTGRISENGAPQIGLRSLLLLNVC